jgi:hypothetical protein
MTPIRSGPSHAGGLLVRPTPPGPAVPIPLSNHIATFVPLLNFRYSYEIEIVDILLVHSHSKIAYSFIRYNRLPLI